MRHLLPILCLTLAVGPLFAAAMPDFPKEAAGLTLEKITDFEKSDPGSGIAWSYRSSSTKADVYIYDLGLPSIPSDLDASRVSEHMTTLVQSIYEVERRGYYSQVETVLRGQKTAIGSIPVWHAELTYIEDGIPRVSHIYLGVWKGDFFKIRYTYYADEKAAEAERLPKFLAAMGNTL